MKKLLQKPKQRGEWVELHFMARAAAHGFTVSKPWGDSARYDFILESRGRFRRVQVKSTSFRFNGAYMCNATSRGPSGAMYRYRRNQIDFFAFYIIPEDLWYIVPVAVMAHTRFAATLNPYQRRSKYFRYLEAWHLLK